MLFWTHCSEADLLQLYFKYSCYWSLCKGCRNKSVCKHFRLWSQEVLRDEPNYLQFWSFGKKKVKNCLTWAEKSFIILLQMCRWMIILKRRNFLCHTYHGCVSITQNESSVRAQADKNHAMLTGTPTIPPQHRSPEMLQMVGCIRCHFILLFLSIQSGE